MADTLSAEQRSRNMARIKGRNTKPELFVRRLLHAAGYRFRLHGAARGGTLPGRPDLVFPGRRKVVFVNGCFWHSHSCRAGQAVPATNAEFWAAKRARTRVRDEAAIRSLAEAGWDSLTVWECELKDTAAVEQALHGFLGPPGGTGRLDSTTRNDDDGGDEAGAHGN